MNKESIKLDFLAIALNIVFCVGLFAFGPDNALTYAIASFNLLVAVGLSYQVILLITWRWK